MAVYLVDFENVTSAGISGIQRLTKEDKVYIFYTVNASNMSFAAHMNLLSSPAEVIYYNVTSGGKNALDFQLASFLGYLISKGEDKDFYIISNDKGYDHVKNFWERSGIAEGVTIHGSPSINRSLIPLEKPFTAKIQQSPETVQQTVPQQNGVSPERLEQMKAEADRYNSRKKAAESAAKEEIVNPNTETDDSAAEKNKGNKKNEEKVRTKPANGEKVSANEGNSEKATEEKPVKRRGRPKKQVTEVVAEETEKAEKIPAKERKTNGNKEKTSAIKESKSSKTNKEKAAEKKPKSDSANGKASVKKESASDELEKFLRPLLARARVESENDITNIANYFRLAEGKQQFYRNLIAIYGMERGVEIYRVIRTEYTNLTKLVK